MQLVHEEEFVLINRTIEIFENREKRKKEQQVHLSKYETTIEAFPFGRFALPACPDITQC
jgi:hypothetical protein